MQGERSRLGLYGLFGAACVGFLGLDQVASSYEPSPTKGELPHMGAALEHRRQAEDDAVSAAADAPPDTPPRQRPAANASIGEGSDALDAPELRRKARVPRRLASPTAPEPAAAGYVRPKVGVPGLAAPPIPRAEHREAPPLTSQIIERGWNDPESQARRGQRAAENGGPAPLWLEAIANQLGVRARFIPLHRPSNTVSRYVDPCDKRDYRCQEFHDNFFREDVPTSPLGMTNSIGAGIAGGIIRAAGADREINPPLMWTVKPRFVGLEAAF